MRTLLIASAALAALVGTAFAASDSDNDTPNTINVGTAKIEGNMITGVSLNAEQAGYLVIHNEGAGAPPASLGHIAVPAGMSTNVTIEATGPLDPSTKISLMLHLETNGNTTYDFGPGSTDVDTPAAVGDVPVTAELAM